MSTLTNIITATDPEIRNRSLDAFCRTASLADLLAECDALEVLRRTSNNLYERVRALFFLYAIHRFHLPLKDGMHSKGLIPFEGYNNLLNRRRVPCGDATGPLPMASRAWRMTTAVRSFSAHDCAEWARCQAA